VGSKPDHKFDQLLTGDREVEKRYYSANDRNREMIIYTSFEHKLIGKMLLVAEGQKLARAGYFDAKTTPDIKKYWRADPDCPVLKKAVRQLRNYLGGKRRRLTVPLQIEGTEFQKKVYELILELPIGTVTTYAKIARKLGMPKASRSVGSAIGKNPLLIFIPDHRVISSGGTSGGFAGKWNRKPLLQKLEKSMTRN
jgi:O-6-methylguanine DNA methyltransferase